MGRTIVSRHTLFRTAAALVAQSRSRDTGGALPSPLPLILETTFLAGGALVPPVFFSGLIRWLKSGPTRSALRFLHGGMGVDGGVCSLAPGEGGFVKGRH